MAGGLHPAVNRIFPYAAPDLSEDCADGSTYHLSLCCLENARDILLTLETEYRALYARNLTLSRLGDPAPMSGQGRMHVLRPEPQRLHLSGQRH